MNGEAATASLILALGAILLIAIVAVIALSMDGIMAGVAEIVAAVLRPFV